MVATRPDADRRLSRPSPAAGRWPILCTYGHRKPDFSIRAVVSDDGLVASGDGPTWGLAPTLVIRSDLPNKDLGYPTTLSRADGRLCTFYYAQTPDGVTCIQSTAFRAP